MTHLIWSRFFVASLIFLGDGAPIPDVNHRSDAEASIINHVVEASTSAFTDDPQSNYHPALIGDNELQAASNLVYQTSSTEKRVVSYNNKYRPFNPRAPPACV